MKLLVINGPNLNNLGRRDVSHYGVTTLAQIEAALGERASALGVDVEFFQSNHEGEIVDFIQRSTYESDANRYQRGSAHTLRPVHTRRINGRTSYR